jgi:hypothetical protein
MVIDGCILNINRIIATPKHAQARIANMAKYLIVFSLN